MMQIRKKTYSYSDDQVSFLISEFIEHYLGEDIEVDELFIENYNKHVKPVDLDQKYIIIDEDDLWVFNFKGLTAQAKCLNIYNISHLEHSVSDIVSEKVALFYNTSWKLSICFEHDETISFMETNVCDARKSWTKQLFDYLNDRLRE